MLRYWSDFIPSWAGAISIDLLPVVLVLVLMIVYDAMRRETGQLEEAETVTAAEMLRSLDLYRQLSNRPLLQPDEAADAPPAETPAKESPPRPEEATPAAEPDKPLSASAGDATVTPLGVSPRKRQQILHQTRQPLRFFAAAR